MNGRNVRLRMLMGALVFGLVFLPIMPAAARTKPASSPRIRPAVSVLPDAWENDDTTTTAKVLPEISYHTFSSSDATEDVDFSRIYAETTGTPFVLEIQFNGGRMDSELAVYKLAADGTLTSLGVNDDSYVWDYAFGSTLFFSAPAPGYYYVKAHPLDAATYNVCSYVMYETKGIARRISGPDRYATSAAVSRTLWPDANNYEYGTDEGPDGIIIANGRDFPDALCGSSFSAMGQGGANNMPLLLVNDDSVPAATAAEFARLTETEYWGGQRMKLYVLGSERAVSDAVVKSLIANGDMPFGSTDIVRLGGTTRFGTAAAVASEAVSVHGSASTVFITTAWNFPDALAATPLSGYQQGPILYSGLTTVGPDTAKWLIDHPTVTEAVIIGSNKVVGDAVAAALAAPPYSLDVTRVAGGDRYETARKTAEFGVTQYGLEPTIFLATGTNFPDALSAGTLSGNNYGVILLTQPTSLSGQVTKFFGDHRDGIEPDPMSATAVSPSYVIGGSPAVSDSVYAAFKALYKMTD